MTLSKTIVLPEPRSTSTVALETAIARRRSKHHFVDQELTPEELSQLLWALQGVTHSGDARSAPSAGGIYPLEIFVSSKDGLFTYDPVAHQLELVGSGDLRRSLSHAALGEEALSEAPAVFIISTTFEKMSERFGEERGVRYALLECGHAAQNILLQAEALGLASVPIGTFRDADVEQFLDLPPNNHVIYLIPVGVPSKSPTSRSPY